MEIQNARKEVKRAVLQAMLLTDGSVVPERNQISFANTSMVLINQFCNLIEDVYDRKTGKLQNGKSAKQHVFITQLKSKEICQDLLYDVQTYRTSPFKDESYPETNLPKLWTQFNNEEIAIILRTIFDTDGGCSLRVAWRGERKCFEIERTLFIACQHPMLKIQYKELLNKLGVKCSISKDKITITSKENFELFRKLINFSDGVLIGYDSKHWQGIEKKELLSAIIQSYNISHGSIQKFEKNQIYSLIRPPSR